MPLHNHITCHLFHIPNSVIVIGFKIPKHLKDLKVFHQKIMPITRVKVDMVTYSSLCQDCLSHFEFRLYECEQYHDNYHYFLIQE